ncbi:MAG: precorrin-4 C(11)-methyltransferase, partial [Cyanobacteria bacterium J06632_22]
EKLIRTTLYLITPALQAHQKTTDVSTTNASNTARSRLYAPSHDHLFRPHKTA